MALEREFLAMRQIDRAFSSLKSPEDKERIIKWTVDKYAAVVKPAVYQAPQHTAQVPVPHQHMN